MPHDKFWDAHRINPQEPPKKKPGLVKREREQADLEEVVTGGRGSAELRRAREATKRQERVARDEPAIEGSDRPSEIRARNVKRSRGY